MSETIAMPPLGNLETRHVPTVYFIDDSATMREVIKIAFRRESIHVITCADASSAISQFEEHPPDVVITDVIMPDQDGYSVCSHIKQSSQYSKTPVILMSGVVNKNVADRAVAVQADELVRKPFQPQELIGRVKNLLGQSNPSPQPISSEDHSSAIPSLSSLFAAHGTASLATQNRANASAHRPAASDGDKISRIRVATRFGRGFSAAKSNCSPTNFPDNCPVARSSSGG